MRKLINLILIFLIFSFCAPKQEKIDRIIEDGVEVIVNHLEPYQIKGEPFTFTLEEEFVIDSERDDLAELGINYMDEFDVDPKGHIYFYSGEQLLAFDNQGHFIQKISRRGQGPGEYLSAYPIRVTASGKVSIFDVQNAKFVFFNPDGTFHKEIKKTSTLFTYEAKFLDNGNFLFRERQNDKNKGIRIFHYALLDRDFKKIKDLNPSFWLEIPYYNPSRISLLRCSLKLEISDEKIYVGSNMNDDMEIEVYDFQGQLLRKVRKKSERIKIPKKYKEKTVERWKKSPAWEEYDLKSKHYFPDHFHPFKDFCVDEEGRIFVETYKEIEEPGKYMIYIFNPEGIFTGSTSLKEARIRKFKNSRMYCVYMKENGFQELRAYKIQWKFK